MFHGFSGNKTVKRKSSHASEDKRGWFSIEMEVSLHLRRLPDLDLSYPHPPPTPHLHTPLLPHPHTRPCIYTILVYYLCLSGVENK